MSDLIEETGEVIDTILSIIKLRYPGSAEKIEFLLREKLENGQCLLLLDALDEVEKEKRSQLQRDLNPFINKFENKTICTSRIVGYSSFLNQGKEMEIVPFTEKQTEEYINVWFDNAEAANVIEDDSVSAIDLINEIKGKPQIQGLTQNPLLLSLVCSLYQTKGLELPARKTQVYEQAVNYMLSQWSADNQRLINDDGWVDSKRELLEYLAYQFSCQHYPQADFITSVLVTLGKIGNDKVVEPLITALSDSVKRNAALALGKIGNEKAVEPLITALGDSDDGFRYYAALELGKIGNNKAVETLITALGDSNNEVRRNAAEALGKINHPDTLTKLLENPDIDIYDSDIFELARNLMIRHSDKIQHPVIRS